MEWRHLKPMGDLGVVVPVPFSPKDTDSIRRVIAGADIVINLIGKVRVSTACGGAPTDPPPPPTHCRRTTRRSTTSRGLLTPPTQRSMSASPS